MKRRLSILERVVFLSCVSLLVALVGCDSGGGSSSGGESFNTIGQSFFQGIADKNAETRAKQGKPCITAEGDSGTFLVTEFLGVPSAKCIKNT